LKGEKTAFSALTRVRDPQKESSSSRIDDVNKASTCSYNASWISAA